MTKKILPLILIALLFASCAVTKIACVGDSITYGSGIQARETLAYPQQLQQMLGKKYEVQNFGVSGATMLKNGNKSYWDLSAYPEALAFNPKIVVIMLGTNDSKPVNWDNYKKEFAADYKEMIDNFKKLKPQPKIYIGLPPPAIEDRWEIQKKVVNGELQQMTRDIAAENNVELIDFFYLFDGKPHLIPDNIHPNAAGAKLMAEEAFKILNK